MRASTAVLILCAISALIIFSGKVSGRDSCCIKIDEYHDISTRQEKRRLRFFALELKGAGPEAVGYVIAYGGRRTCLGEAKARGERAQVYLASAFGVGRERVVIIDGGHRAEPTVELWMGWRGGRPPIASPTLAPREVKMMERCEGSMRRRRA